MVAAVGIPVMLVGISGGLLSAGLGTWMNNWGATMVETAIPLPGDELLPDATTLGTKAITIKGTPQQIWPWIAQMGIGRGGMYSYDWIERVIGSGDFVDGHSADRIHPELQSREVGDEMMMHPPTDMKYTVALVQAPRVIVYRGTSIGAVTWTFYLVPNDDGTRLITRWRGQPANGTGEELANTVFGAMDFVMEQKMLRGIKERVERPGAADEQR
jgi:hypothetical protein